MRGVLGNKRSPDMNCCGCYLQCGILDVSQFKSDSPNAPGIKTISARALCFSHKAC